MNIEFTEQEKDLADLLILFDDIDPEEAIFMNHYELARVTGIHSSMWKEFLTHPKIASFIDSEILLYQKHQLKQMVRDASDDKRAVGAAQMINALAKLDTTKEKTGPYIIYTHVPLTESQEGSPVEYRQEQENVLQALETWEEDPIT